MINLSFSLVTFKKVIRQIFFITTAIAFGAGGVEAQVASYTFANSAGAYTALTGGATWQSGTTVTTDLISGDIPIGFTFRYNGANYTNLRISNNGFIIFGNQSPANNNYTPISQSSNSGTATDGYDGAISGFGANLRASSGSATIIYGADGSDFVVQFTEMARTGQAADRITFQIRLTQTTNVISIVYGTCSATTNATVGGFPQVGLRGASYFDWKNLSGTTSTTWSAPTATNTAGTAVSTLTMRFTSNTTNPAAPASGRTFTFTPPAELGAPTYATLPATENFDASPWVNGNAVQDLPNVSNWRSWPSFGDRSWRRQNVTAGANSGWASVTGAITIVAPAATGAATFNNYDACGTRTGYLDYYVNFSSAGTKSLTFDLRNPGTASLRIYVSTDGGATFGSAVGAYTSTVANWTSQSSIVLGSSTSSTVVVRFEATSAYGSTSTNLGIDNVSITSSSCGQPTALSSTNVNYITASISWTAPSGTPIGYEYEVRTSGAAGSGATGLAASGSTTDPTVTANITGLSGATAYTYYVRTDCGSSSFSSWASSTFTTLSCNVPTGVGSSAVAATTATISWTAPVVGSPTGYQWEVRSSGAAGSGATGLAASGSTTSPTVTASVVGLAASTAYNIYVRTNCAAGLNSSWTTASSFTTACAAITALPHTEAFGTYLPSTCWQEGDAGDLTAGPTTLSASVASWAADGFLNSGSSGAAKINLDATGDNDWLISPEFTLPASPNYRLKYSVGATEWGATTAPATAWEADDFVQVLISTTGNTNWTILRTYNSGNVPSHLGQMDMSDLTAYAGQTFRIAFRGVEGATNGGADIDFFIDNFIIEEVPSCVEPNTISSSSVNYTTATINWVAPSGTPIGYEYEVRTSGAAGSGATGLAASGSTTDPTVTANITGLTGATAYTYYVRTDCGSSNYSTWASSTFTTLSCNVPTSVTSSAITSGTATISWTAPVVGSPAGYEWEVRSSGAAGSGATGLAASGTTTSPTVSASVTGLAASTSYNIHVRTNCATVLNSSWTTASAFTTACAAITALPHTEAFGTYLPSTCWQEGDGGDLTAGPTTVSASAASWAADGFLNSGTTGAAWIRLNAAVDNDWLISPEFTLPASPYYRLKYSVGATQRNASTALTTAWETDDFVQVLISTTGTTDWTVLTTYNSGNVPSHLGQIDISDLTAYAGQTFRISFRGVEGVSDGGADIDFFIDNLIIEEVPSCVEPTAPSVSSVTTTSASVSWTAPSPAPSNGYFYAVTTSATPPANGSGTAAPATGPHSVSLSANTTYYLHVQGFCGGSDYSTWATSAVFNTLEGNTCLQAQDLALLTSPFNGTTIGYSNSFTTSNGSCLTGTGGDRVFRIDVANNYELFIGQSANGYDSRHRIAVGGSCPGTTEINTGYVANFPTTQINGTTAGCLDDNDLTHYYYKNISGSTQTVYWVQDCQTAGQGTFTLEWQLVAPPSCLAPTAPSVSSVTATSANVLWTAPSPAPSNGYFYAVTTSATPPANGSGTTVAGTGPHSVSLSANTTYYLHVQGFCSGSDYSTWATSAVFTTPCADITSLPWTEGFEGLSSVSTTTFPACWLEGTGTNWRSQDVSTTSYNDPRTGSKYIGCVFLGTNDRIWTPGFQLTAGVSYDFSTYFVGDGYSGWNGEIVYNTSQSAAGETVLGAAFISSSTTSTSGTNYAQISRTFVAPSTGTYYFGVRITSTSTPWSSMSFDDFSLTQLANCSGAPSAGTPPVGTNVCSGSTTTLTVTGATTGSGISYQWEEWNGSAWVAAVGGSGAATASYTTPALTATKQYRFTVLCTPSSQSASTTGVTITVGAPANDACASAQTITVGASPITGSVACAAAGGGGCGGSTSDYDVWYSFSVTTAGDHRVNLLPSASFDGLFQLYDGCGGSLVSSPSNSFGGTATCIDGYVAGFPEYAIYNLTVGTYYLRVYDYNPIGIAYPTTTDFTIEVVVPVDPCLSASSIAVCGSAVNTVIASGTGAWDNYYDCASLTYSLLGREAIYTFTPTQSSSGYSITLNSLSPNGGGNYLNIMYKASTCSGTGTWDCIDEVNSTGTTPNFSMTAGTTYYFLIKPELTAGYTVNWQINCPPAPPVNDACANATPLPCGTTNLAGTTVSSVTETVSIGCTMSPFGVWYSFVGNGFSTTVSSTATFDHEMGIASGSCGALVNIACRDAVSSGNAETHTFTTAVGVTYYVYIGHWSSANTITGTFTISRTCAVNEWTGNAMNSDWATNGNWSTGTAPNNKRNSLHTNIAHRSEFPHY
jgi:hypothetical protein